MTIRTPIIKQPKIQSETKDVTHLYNTTKSIPMNNFISEPSFTQKKLTSAPNGKLNKIDPSLRLLVGQIGKILNNK